MPASLLSCDKTTNAAGQTAWKGIYVYGRKRAHEETFDRECPAVVVVKE